MVIKFEFELRLKSLLFQHPLLIPITPFFAITSFYFPVFLKLCISCEFCLLSYFNCSFSQRIFGHISVNFITIFVSGQFVVFVSVYCLLYKLFLFSLYLWSYLIMIMLIPLRCLLSIISSDFVIFVLFVDLGNERPPNWHISITNSPSLYFIGMLSFHTFFL